MMGDILLSQIFVEFYDVDFHYAFVKASKSGLILFFITPTNNL